MREISNMLVILFIFFLSASFGLCNIQIGILGQAAAEATATATWSRNPEDPQIISLAKVKLDESPALTSPPFSINTPGALAGELPLPFNRAGIFHLIALDATNKVIQTSEEFGVKPPDRFVSESDTTPNLPPQTSTPQSPSPSVKLMTDKTASPRPSQLPTKGKTQTPIIVGTVLGVIFALLLAVVAFIVLRNRRIHRQQVSIRKDMLSRLPSYNFGTIVTPARSYQSGDPEKMGDMMIDSPMSDLNYRHVPRLSPNSPNPSQPTERQIELDQRISELYTTITSLRNAHDTGSVSSAGDDLRIWKLLNQIESLKRLKASPWALGLTDTLPDELA